LTYVKLTETETSKTNFTTEQKVDFNRATSTTFVVTSLFFYVYVQHSIVINSSIFQVIIAVRPITLVTGKISYEDKARVETL